MLPLRMGLNRKIRNRFTRIELIQTVRRQGQAMKLILITLSHTEGAQLINKIQLEGIKSTQRILTSLLNKDSRYVQVGTASGSPIQKATGSRFHHSADCSSFWGGARIRQRPRPGQGVSLCLTNLNSLRDPITQNVAALNGIRTNT